MKIEEHAAWIYASISEEDYERPVTHFALMHPLKAALVMEVLLDRLATTEKVLLHNKLERALLKHFAVEKHGLSVREFTSLNAAERWVDGSNGARLVEGEK